MGIFSKLKEKRALKSDPSGKPFRWAMARRLAGQTIKYVTERVDGEDEVIGRGGSLSIRGDEFLVFASSDVLFRCRIDDMASSELLSKDGVILTAPDLEHGGRERTVIVYFVYYLK